MLKWLKKLKIYLHNHPSSFSFLKNHNFYNIKPYKLLDWHPDTFYYLVKKNSTKFFIKISKDKLKIKREVKNNLIMKECLNEKYLIKMEDYAYSKFRSFIMFEFINDSSSLTKNNFNFFSSEILNIIKKINTSGFIHRDIRPDNFLIKNNILKIIDFEFLTSLEFDDKMELDIRKKENLIKLLNCGSKYKLGNFIWNDFYSFFLISKNFNLDIAIDDDELREYFINSNYTILNEKINLRLNL